MSKFEGKIRDVGTERFAVSPKKIKRVLQNSYISGIPCMSYSQPDLFLFWITRFSTMRFQFGLTTKTSTLSLRRLDTLPVPVITRINGVAYGGGSELSTIGDIRIATPNARVAFVHKKMALQPGWGGAARLVKVSFFLLKF